MIGGIIAHTGGGRLAAHLAIQKGHLEVGVRAVGLSAGTIATAVRELELLASISPTRRPLIHAWASPSTCYTPTQWSRYWALFEAEFDIVGYPHLEVKQRKLGRGGRTASHTHRIYLRVRPDGRTVRLSHCQRRQEKLSRISEYETGEVMIRGAHNRAVAQALAKEGRGDVVDAMTRAGLLEGPRPVAPTPQERARAERAQSLAPDEIWMRSFDAWRRTETAAQLDAALAAVGLVLAQGDRGPVVVAPGGQIVSLRRAVSAGARAAGGTGIKSAAVNERLAGFELPSVETALATARPARLGAARPTGQAIRAPHVPPIRSLELDLTSHPVASNSAEGDAAAPGGIAHTLPNEPLPAPRSAPASLTQEQIRLGHDLLASLLGGAAEEARAIRVSVEEEAHRNGAVQNAAPTPSAERRRQVRSRAARLGLEGSAPRIAAANWRDAYKAQLAALPRDLGHLIRWVDRVEAGYTVIQLRSGTTVRAGPLLATADRATADTVTIMIEHAVSRGWHAVEISGGTAEWRDAMRVAALEAGLEVGSHDGDAHLEPTFDTSATGPP